MNSTLRACLPCLPGTAQPDVSGQPCQPCGKGTYTFARGSTSCLPCPSGQFTDLVGATGCSVCPALCPVTPRQRSCYCPNGTYVGTSGIIYETDNIHEREGGSDFSWGLLGGVVGIIGVVVIAVIGVMMWVRRGGGDNVYSLVNN